MGLHVAEGTGAVAVAFVGAGGDGVALGAVADLVLAAGLGIRDGLGVLLAVFGVESHGPGGIALRDGDAVGNALLALALHADLLVALPAGPVSADRGWCQVHRIPRKATGA